MKQNSRATNLRHLQDALAALSAAAADARVRAAKAPAPSSPGTPPPLRLATNQHVVRAAYRAAQVGATEREIAAAALQSMKWARWASKYDALSRARQDA